MECLLIDTFIEEDNVEVTNPKALFNLVQTCSRKPLNIIFQDHPTFSVLEKYVAYEGKVRASHLGKTDTFWLSVIDTIRLVLMLLYSLKTNNSALFHKCNRVMADVFFSYDGPNYSR